MSGSGGGCGAGAGTGASGSGGRGRSADSGVGDGGSGSGGLASVGTGSRAVLGDLLLDARRFGIGRAVVIAGQQVLVVGAEAGPVVAGAGVDLALQLRGTGIENAGRTLVCTLDRTPHEHSLLSSAGRSACGRC